MSGYPKTFSASTTSNLLSGLAGSTHYHVVVTYRSATKSFSDSSGGSADFTTLPADPQKSGDVIGNNGFVFLDGVFKTGHVGIWGGNIILEVLDDSSGLWGTCVHYNRALAQFKNDGYWGARYSSSVTPSVASQIVLAGVTQGTYYAKYNPAVLTCVWGHWGTSLVWDAKTRTYVAKTVLVNASLRCDYFVAGCYANGSTVNISPTFWTPSTVFSKLPSQR